ncbi:MAG: PTS system mannose/fructose/sorbose family transporter subunit IID [Deltaproteobacteria bacterium]|nr:PTS system mannose/fructose/sorbose family transporter subunit IID [Deltaproteobacteria bacterium]
MLRVFFNSLFLQAAWNFDRMQNLGFAASIAPALKKIYREGFASALKRHTEFFNTHPYMAAPILGAVVRLEEEVKDGRRDASTISSFKKATMGPYGAIGDNLFWGSIKPFAAMVGVMIALTGSLWAPIVFLIIFNIPHLWMRVYGLSMGYRLGEEVVGYIKALDLPWWGRRVRDLTLIMVGTFLALYWWRMGNLIGFDSANLPVAFVLIVIVMWIAWLLRHGFSASLTIYLVCALLLLFNTGYWLLTTGS